MARKSLTFVKVGPGVSRSPSGVKKPVELLSARKAAGSRPSARARAAVGAVHARAGGVFRRAGAAIGAVGIAGQRVNPFFPVERERQSQRIFLVRSAAALAADRHGELAAGQDHGAAALPAQSLRRLRLIGGDVARFAFEIGAEEKAIVSGGANGRLCRLERIRGPRGEMELRIRKSRIAGLRGFVRPDR